MKTKDAISAREALKRAIDRAGISPKTSFPTMGQNSSANSASIARNER
jgi:hypothetical protein